MRTSSPPTMAGAARAVRRNRDARFAAVLAAVFAFSAGFALGVVIGSTTAEPEVGVSGAG